MEHATRLDEIERKVKCLEDEMVKSKPDIQLEMKFNVGNVCWDGKKVVVLKEISCSGKDFEQWWTGEEHIDALKLTLIPQPKGYGVKNKSLNIKNRFEQNGKQYEIVACRKLKSGDSWIAPGGDIYHDACDDNTHIRFIVESVEPEVEPEKEKTMQPTDEKVLQALKDSRPHWLANTSVDYLEGAKTNSNTCALCDLFDCCRKKGCPLYENDVGHSCCKEWYKAKHAFLLGNLPEFRKASLDMVKRLDREIAKLEGKVGEPISASGKRNLFPDLVCKTEERELEDGFWHWGKYFEESWHLVQYNKTVNYADTKPATLSDLAVEIDGVKCWFLKKMRCLYIYSEATYDYANENTLAYKAFVELAELKHASVICEEQWKRFDKEENE